MSEEKQTDGEDKVMAAVAAERERCAAWASAMRSGRIDDIRSVISAIRRGDPISVLDEEA